MSENEGMEEGFGQNTIERDVIALSDCYLILEPKNLMIYISVSDFLMELLWRAR